MYKDLKLSDRARIIEMAVKSGIKDLKTIEEVYNTFETGGPKSSGWNIGSTLVDMAKERYLKDYARKGYVLSYPSNPVEAVGYVLSPYLRISGYQAAALEDFPEEVMDARRALFAKNFGVDPTGESYENAIVESKYKPTVSQNPDAKYYTLPIEDARTRYNYLSSTLRNYKIGSGEDERGKYFSVYDIWDLAPFNDKGNNFPGTTPPEIYDRFYQSEIPEMYEVFSDPNFNKHQYPNETPFDLGGHLFADGGPEGDRRISAQIDNTFVSSHPMLNFGDAVYVPRNKVTTIYSDPEFIGPLTPYQQLVVDNNTKRNRYFGTDNPSDEYYNDYIQSSYALSNATISKHPELLGLADDWSISPLIYQRGLSESPEADEAIAYFQSYADSPGFDRTRKNQVEYLKELGYDDNLINSSGALDATDLLRKGLRDAEFGDTYNVGLPPARSVHHIVSGTNFVGTEDADGIHPYNFVLAHELLHKYNPTKYGAQNRALAENENTEYNGHDELTSEKHSDVEGLKYLLFKEGIYDARGERDCTPADIEILRKRYPELRPLLQMDDEQAAWMINHVADAGKQESLYDNHLGNIAAHGGKLRKLMTKL